MNLEVLKTIDYNHSAILCQPEDNHKNFDIGVIADGGKRLISLALGVKAKVWTEVLYLAQRKDIKNLYSVMSNADYKNRFMFEAINELAKDSDISVRENNHKPVIKVNNIKTLKRIIKI